MTRKSFSVCLRISGSVLMIVSLYRMNYSKAVHSITESVKSQLAVSSRDIKLMMNNEVAGLGGASQRFSGKRSAKMYMLCAC